MLLNLPQLCHLNIKRRRARFYEPFVASCNSSAPDCWYAIALDVGAVCHPSKLKITRIWLFILGYFKDQASIRIEPKYNPQEIILHADNNLWGHCRVSIGRNHGKQYI
jgi:hypothetical protein